MRRSITLVISLLMMASMTYAQKPSGYNLKQGDKFTMTRVTDVATKQQAMGQSTEISEITTVVEALEVIAVSNNVYTIKSTPTKRKLAISAPMMSQEMNSDLDGNQNLPFKMLTGESYSFTMDKFGKILQFKDLDKMKGIMRKKFTSSMFATAADDLLSVFDEALLKRELEAQFSFYNTASGDKWTKKVTIVTAELPIELTNAYRWDNDKTILVEADIKMNGATVISGMNMSFDMNGNQQSIVDLDQKNGMPLKLQTIQTLKGEMEAQNTKVPTTMITKTTTTIAKN